MGMTIRLAPGTGRLSRHRDDVLFVPTVSEGFDDIVTAFRECSGDVIDALTDIVVARSFEVPAFACLVGGGRVALLVYGDVEVRTDHPAVPLLSGASSQTWVEHTLRGKFESVSVEVTPEDVADDTDLVVGTVPASGFRTTVTPSLLKTVSAPPSTVTTPKASTPAAATPAAPSWPASSSPGAEHVGDGDLATAESDPSPERSAQDPAAAEPSPAAPGPDTDEDLLAMPASDGLDAIQSAAVGPGTDQARSSGVGEMPVAVPSPNPAPDAPSPGHQVPVHRSSGGAMVEAVHCPDGHANQPGSKKCRVCDAAVALDAAVDSIERPSLGKLELDNGKSLVLAMNYVLGRKPTATPPAVAAPLEGEKISRNHLAVELRGWDVHIRDLGSTNGTYLSASQGQPWQKIQPEVDVRITPGATVRLDQRTLTYKATA